MRIQNNITADNSHRQLGINQRNISLNTEKLSSGYRVNRAADDAAGLAISEKMRTQIKGLNRASLNIQDGVSLLQVGDGALQFIHNKMQRLRELAVQAANDTNQDLDREAIQLEFGQLTSEVNQVVSTTNFNGKLLFDGSIGAPWEYNLGRITTPYTTTIPATDEFEPLGANVPGFTINPVTFGVATGVRTDLRSPAYTFPPDGLFAMQIVTPADGTLNVILDFSSPSFDGTLDGPNGFLAFFRNEFNSLGREMGFDEDIVENIRYIPTTGRIEFDFPNVGTPPTLTGVMGKPGPEYPVPPFRTPRVFIGLGFGTGTGGNYNAAAQRDSLNGEATFWSTDNIRTNRPDLVGTFNDSTNFANGAIFSSPGTLPGPAGATQPPAPGFSNFTINFNGKPTIINLIPGQYPTAQSFVDAHQKLFETAMPRGFNLDIDTTTGKLVVTTKGQSASMPSVTMTINPTSLGDELGFGPSPAIRHERPPGGSLAIQSGANKGDLTHIEIPRLCTRSLGVSIRRPEDLRLVEDGGFAHINRLGADGYRILADVDGDPMEYALDVTSHDTASASLAVLTNAINIISTERARMGAQQNRLEFAMKNVDNTAENLQAAESRIRDVDMAAEMTTFVQNQILVQSSTAMLAQANALPQGVLQLLG